MDADNFGRVLREVKGHLDNQRTLLGVYNIRGNHWVSYCLLKGQGKTSLLYKDSFGSSGNDFAQILQLVLGELELKAHDGEEQKGDGTHCGIFALENIRIMADHLNTKEFVENFTGFKNFCSLDRAKMLRETDFANAFVRSKWEAIKLDAQEKDKRRQVREKHHPELIEIADKLKGLRLDLTLKALKSNESLDRKGSQKTIAIDISIQLLKNGGYTYSYLIYHSHDLLSETIKEILLKSDFCINATRYTINDGTFTIPEACFELEKRQQKLGAFAISKDPHKDNVCQALVAETEEEKKMIIKILNS